MTVTGPNNITATLTAPPGSTVSNLTITPITNDKTPILPKYHRTQAYIDGFKDGWVYQNKELTEVNGDYGTTVEKDYPASSVVN